MDAIKIIYKDSAAAVITPVGITKLFQILSGIFQGDTLSPFLFIIVIDYILRQAYKTTTEDHGIQIIPRRGTRHPPVSIKDLAYADDVTLLSHTLKQAEELLHKLEAAALEVGLVVNEDKTEIVAINQTQSYQAKTSNGKTLKEVENLRKAQSLDS